ncbi:MAG: DNA repair protein RadA [Phycisphaerales bacterium]
MAKIRTTFLCRSCGGVQARWMGKCPDCGAWDSLEEHREAKGAKADTQRGVAAGASIVQSGDAGEILAGAAPGARPIGELLDSPASVPRIPTGIGELDRVLGGGLVPGSVVLVGGDPGIGKSTLMLQAAARISSACEACGHVTPPAGDDVQSNAARTVLYVSSEESAEQIAMRADRLGVSAGRLGNGERASSLFVLADTNLARIVEQVRRVGPDVVVIDSVQMVYKGDIDASPGSAAQLRRCCSELVYLAKLTGVAIVLVGHVTKDGQLAGPRLLEHLVDAVLYFEGDRYHAHRIIRGVKNRFGTTLEIGIFEMTGSGLREAPEGLGVAASSADAGAGGKGRVGSVVCPIMSGLRCVMVEVQALTATGFLGAAKRKSSGLDANRLAMLIAVLEQHAGMRLADRDIFASSVGGLRVVEPASDLALLLAIAGAHLRKSLPAGTAVVGEVGLGGEARAVSSIEQRVREAARLGFRRVVIPAVRGKAAESINAKDVELVRVRTVSQAIEELG